MELTKLNLPDFQFNLKQKGEQLFIKGIIRNKLLLLTPEEWVRQNFIAYLITYKSIPKNLIAVEKKLLVNGLTKRFDILAYDNAGVPIVLIECKAPKVKITESVFEQISSYNMTLRVPFLIITNGIDHIISKVDFQSKKSCFLTEIPDFVKYY